MNTHSLTIDKHGPFSRNSAVVQIRAIPCLQRADYHQSYVCRRSFIALEYYHVMNMSYATKVAFMYGNLITHTGSDLGTILFRRSGLSLFLRNTQFDHSHDHWNLSGVSSLQLCIFTFSCNEDFDLTKCNTA